MRRIMTMILTGAAIAAAMAACGDIEEELPASAAADPKLTRAELIERVRPAIAKVFVETPFGEFSGSAVTIDAEKGHLLTSAHVVEGASTIELRFSGSKERHSARVLGSSLCPDLALLELDDIPAGGLTALPFADSAEVEVGDTVAVVGYEGNVRSWHQANARVAFGTVGDKNIRNADLGPDIGPQGRLLLTDAAVNPGSSGGAIVTEDGEVAAITTLKGGDDQGYGIQADVVREALPDLQAGETGTGLQTIPVRSMAHLLVPYFVDEGFPRSTARALAQYVYDTGGLFVIGVDPGSPADRKGLEFGDIVVTMNGLSINNQKKHCRVLGSSSVVKVEGYRLGDWSDFTSRLTVR
jgi:S1-C subfamily serine protease